MHACDSRRTPYANAHLASAQVGAEPTDVGRVHGRHHGIDAQGDERRQSQGENLFRQTFRASRGTGVAVRVPVNPPSVEPVFSVPVPSVVAFS